jgi:O-antigen/teichoic acid export membrane protein
MSQSPRISERLQRVLLRLPGGSFGRSVIVLAGGTAFGQALTVLLTPVLTRIYSPADFGVLSVYTAILGLLTGVGSLRYELAIPLAEDNEAASDLLALSLTLLFITCLGLEGVALRWGSELSTFLRVPEMGRYFWLIPVGIFGASLYQILNYMAIRKQSFGLIARTKLNQGIAQVLVQLGGGLLGLKAGGLLSGDVIGRVFGSGTLVSKIWKEDQKSLKRISLQSIKRTAVRFKRFPLLSSGSFLLNSAGTQLPMMLFTRFYGSEVSGLFSLAQRLISIPMVLIGQSIAQVYFSELSRIARENPDQLLPMFRRTTLRLLLIGGAPIAVGGLLAPWLFAFIIGESWREAGVYTQITTIMFVVQFVAAPVSQSLNVLERQDLQLLWDGGRLVAVVATLVAAHALGASPRWALGLFGAISTLTYFWLLALVMIAIKKNGSGAAISC